MKQTFSASVWREEGLYVAKCLEIDVVSQGESEEEALADLREDLELHLDPPHSTAEPRVRIIETRSVPLIEKVSPEAVT